jgi:hypothetical protein
VFDSFVGRYRNGRYVDAPADRFGDFAKRHAFFCDRMIPHAARALLECEAIETRRVEPVNRRPTVCAVAGVCRPATLPSAIDE